jgi:hypothetical protein
MKNALMSHKLRTVLVYSSRKSVKMNALKLRWAISGVIVELKTNVTEVSGFLHQDRCDK